MISAIQNNQVSVELKEDTLTSSVFDHLLSLPDSLFWHIIKKSCYDNSMPDSIDCIESFEFWPHWDPDGTRNEKYVEPDLFIRFRHFDIIIESKRKDYNQQNTEQWKREFKTYINEYGKDNRNVYLIALGGIIDKNEYQKIIDNYGNLTVVMCRWGNILDTLVKTLDNIENCSVLNNQNIIRNINMVIAALEIHGYIKIRWLEELLSSWKNKITYNKNSEVMKNWGVTE